MSVLAMGTPRNGLPATKPYVYRGAGCDTLTAGMSQRQLELDALAHGAPAGAAEAAALLARRYHPDVDSDSFLLLMCGPCWDDNCTACQQGACKCACRDEPVPDPRCGDCGYLIRGINHKIVCGGTS